MVKQVSRLAAVTLVFSFILPVLRAQSPSWNNPGAAHTDYDEGRAPSRVQFVSYDIRDEADRGDLANATYFVPLTQKASLTRHETGTTADYSMDVNIPFPWLDRELFFHVGGVPEFELYVNGKYAGRGQGGRLPVEFNVSKALTDGVNNITVRAMGSGGFAHFIEFAGASQEVEFYLYSQPKVRIENFTVEAVPDSLGKHGVLKLEIALANGFNFSEPVTVGYDIYSPAGKLLYYDMKDVNLAGNGRDTVRISEPVYGAMQNLWSASSPSLYRLMFFVKVRKRMIEYIPYQAGFGTVSWNEHGIMRNGKKIDVHAVSYNAAPLRGQTAADLKGLRERGINTVCVDYPQPDWFYDLCDATGMYVIEQSDINCNYSGGVEITPGNDPEWLPILIKRTEACFERNRNRTCVIAWSIGGDCGAGYNLYKCYQWLKAADPSRPVLYRGADGDWNSDLPYPAVRPAEEILRQPVPDKAPAKKPSTRR